MVTALTQPDSPEGTVGKARRASGVHMARQDGEKVPGRAGRPGILCPPPVPRRLGRGGWGQQGSYGAGC